MMIFEWIFRRRVHPPPTVEVLGRDDLMMSGAVLVLTREQARRLGWIG